MDINSKDFFYRVSVVFENMNQPIFVYNHPVHGELTAYTRITNFNKANPNVNNYNEVSGVNITDFITDKWLSVFQNNAFNQVYADQIFSTLQPETVQFPFNWGKWWYISKK